MVRAGRDERRKETLVAESIVDSETEAFLGWMKSLQATPTIVALRQHLHDVADHEMSRYRARLGALSPAQEEALRQMVASLVNKLLHFPTLALKRSAAENGGGFQVKVIREIFGIEPPSDATSEPAGAGDPATEPEEITARQDNR